MTSTESTSATALAELLRDGKLTGSWSLDPSRTRIALRSKSVWGLVGVKGVFGAVEGHGTVLADGQASGTITVAADSIDTKMKKRDEHLRSADFLDVADYPSIIFTADQITPSAGVVTVTGSLTVHGTTRPMTLTAQVSSPEDREVLLDGEVSVNRGDFGLTWNQLGMSSMHTAITVHAVFTKQ